jgi:hypothetical protein
MSADRRSIWKPIESGGACVSSHRDPGIEIAVEAVAVQHVGEHDAGRAEETRYRDDRRPVRAGAADRLPERPAISAPTRGANGMIR